MSSPKSASVADLLLEARARVPELGRDEAFAAVAHAAQVGALLSERLAALAALAIPAAAAPVPGDETMTAAEVARVFQRRREWVYAQARRPGPILDARRAVPGGSGRYVFARSVIDAYLRGRGARGGLS